MNRELDIASRSTYTKAYSDAHFTLPRYNLRKYTYLGTQMFG